MTRLRFCLLALVLSWVPASVVHAHMVVTQHGTLNIVEDGAYMVLSLPVSALHGVDDNQDGLLSIAELRSHSATIEAQIKQGVNLHSTQGASKLEGLMLNIEAADNSPMAPSRHLLVLGRFAINPQASEMVLRFQLFGQRADEQTEHIAVTRGAASQLLILTPAQPQGALLPSAWVIFTEQLRLGAFHVLSGADHLLFLLVVLAAGWRFRLVLLALTCFTAGHALTLLACAWLGVSLPAVWVEPAIAATIVFMALFDRWSAQRNLSKPVLIRMGLVFACALIHGLGLAGAWGDLGLQGAGRAWSLAGFNAGIELGQLVVVVSIALVMRAIKWIGGVASIEKTTRWFSYAAVALGSFWFIQRALG